MKIALIGYGKMGRLVEEIAQQRGHTICATIRSTNSIDSKSLLDAEACIDFSHPDCVMEHIRQVTSLKKQLVVGTTGWYQHLPEVRALVQKHATGLFYAPNFSVGVNLFLQIIAHAAKLINQFEEYDVGIMESHHQHKVDAPSGTAKAIAQELLKGIKHKQDYPIASVRCGSIPGTHSVLFDSPNDTITLTHEARNREGFARGAVIAAEWLQNKTGLFTMNDLN